MIKFTDLRVDSKSNKLIIDALVLDNGLYDNIYIKKLFIHTQDTLNTTNPTSETGAIFNISGASLYYTAYITNNFINSFFTAHSEYVEFKESMKTVILDKNVKLYYVGDRFRIVYGGKYLMFDGEKFNFNNQSQTNQPVNFTASDVLLLRKRVLFILENTQLIFSTSVNMNKTLFFVVIQCDGIVSADTPCGMDSMYSIGVTCDLCLIYNNILPDLKQIGKQCSIPLGLIDKYLLFKALQVAAETEHYLEAIKYYNKFFLSINTTTYNCGCNG